MRNDNISDSDMRRRSLISSGNQNRLWSVMRKANRCETITFSVIGGSITQGCHAAVKSESYAELVHKWWKEKFPNTPVNYINAGIGATDSYIGVHRLSSDLLCHKPDIVIVEFSVNDTDEELNSRSYRSLIHSVLESENKPAVILLFTVSKDGVNLQDVHARIGAEYNLPMISLANAVFPEFEKKSLRREDLFSDDVHPSSGGHQLIAELLCSYLDKTYSAAYSTDVIIDSLPEIKDIFYKNAVIFDNRSIAPCESCGFSESDEFRQFPYGWTADGSGRIAFESEFKNLGIMFLRTTDGKKGTFSVYVDGTEAASLDGYFPDGWGDYADYRQVYVSDARRKHRIEIKASQKSENRGFTVLGLCIS